VRLLLELLAMQADVLTAYLDRIYEEAYLETSGDDIIRRLGDGSMRIEFGDGARGRRPPFEDRRLVATYRRGAGEVTLAYLPAEGMRKGAPRTRRQPR
jgi:hypothetical protein